MSSLNTTPSAGVRSHESESRPSDLSRASAPTRSSLAPDISFHLERLAALKQSGSLVIVRPEATSTLVFSHGEIALAKGGFSEARLGRALLDQGGLNEVELIQALSAQQADRCQVPLGRFLVGSGRVDPAKVESALELQCHRVLGAVLASAQARYHWLAGTWGDFTGRRHRFFPLTVDVLEAIRLCAGADGKV